MKALITSISQLKSGISYFISLSLSTIGAQSKCTKRWKQSSEIKQLFETLFLAINMCTDFTTDVIWMNTVSAVLLVNVIVKLPHGAETARARKHF